MPVHRIFATPSASDGSDPQVVQALVRACADFGADPMERLALFEAAIVASNLRIDRPEHDDRIGVLAQNCFWGKDPARRDPYTAATVFLRQARHLRGTCRIRSAARLAAAVQGRPGAWRHATAGRAARQILAHFDPCPALRVRTGAVVTGADTGSRQAETSAPGAVTDDRVTRPDAGQDATAPTPGPGSTSRSQRSTARLAPVAQGSGA